MTPMDKQLTYDEVFTFDNLYRSYKQSRKGVLWKASTQKFKANVLLNVYTLYEALRKRKYRSRGFHEFDVYERGKLRRIRSVHISERVVQRCLCDYCLVPIISKALVYDNSASLKDKGYHFAVNRLTKHLAQHYRKYGRTGYVLLFDFRKYFDNIEHEPLFRLLERYIIDEDLLKISKHFVRQFGVKGLGLGSQVSQIFALLYPNVMDHTIKEQLRIKGFGRYNNDGYLIAESKEHLKECLSVITRVCGELGITLNNDKTQIVKLTRGFKFLKVRFRLTESGKIVKTLSPENITRHRRKIRRLSVKVKSGQLEAVEIDVSMQSWRGHAKKYKSYRTIERMDGFVKQLLEEVHDDN